MSKIRKKTVELQPAHRPSRIRREPPPAAERADGTAKRVLWNTSEGEIWLAIIGIVAFAIAIDIIVVAISAYTN